MFHVYDINAPSDITYFQLGVPKEYREALVKESYRLKEIRNKKNNPKFQEIFPQSENTSLISTSDQVWHESKVFIDLLANILDFISKTSPGINSNYEITNAWVGIFEKNHLVKKHHHSPSFTSFCYYIEAEEPYTPIIFNDVDIEIDAITDRLIIFKSYLTHSVPPCNGGTRIVLAGNVSPTFKTPEGDSSGDIGFSLEE